MHKNIDRCKETTSTTGTGTLTLTGAVSGFVAVADATNGLTSNGDTGWFCAENGAEWEVFLGTRVDATHLARTTVISSSNSGSAVSFTAPPVVFSTVPGAKLSPANGPAVSAYRATSNQSITTSTYTKVALNSETFDLGSCFDSTTNYRWTPNVEGYYQMSWAVYIGATSLTSVLSSLYKNGAVVANGTYNAGVGGLDGISTGAKLVYLNGTTDYLELFGRGIGTTVVIKFGEDLTYMSGFLARPA